LSSSKIIFLIIFYALIFSLVLPLVCEVVVVNYFPNSNIIEFIFSNFFGLTVLESMPDYAWVIVNEDNYYPALEYYAKKVGYTPQMSSNSDQMVLPDEVMMRAEEARSLNYNAKGNFTGNYQFITTYLLRKHDIIPPLKSRWNKDGSWNW